MLETYRRALGASAYQESRVDFVNSRLPDAREAGFDPHAYACHQDADRWFQARYSLGRHGHPSTVLVETIVDRQMAPAQTADGERAPAHRIEAPADRIKGAPIDRTKGAAKDGTQTVGTTSAVTRKLELTTAGFFDFLFSARWKEGCLLRVLKGQVLDDVISAMAQLQVQHDVISYVTAAYIHTQRAPVAPCIKSAEAGGTGGLNQEKGGRTVEVLVEFDYICPQQHYETPDKDDVGETQAIYDVTKDDVSQEPVNDDVSKHSTNDAFPSLSSSQETDREGESRPSLASIPASQSHAASAAGTRRSKLRHPPRKQRLTSFYAGTSTQCMPPQAEELTPGAARKCYRFSSHSITQVTSELGQDASMHDNHEASTRSDDKACVHSSSHDTREMFCHPHNDSHVYWSGVAEGPGICGNREALPGTTGGMHSEAADASAAEATVECREPAARCNIRGLWVPPPPPSPPPPSRPPDPPLPSSRRKSRRESRRLSSEQQPGQESGQESQRLSSEQQPGQESGQESRPLSSTQQLPSPPPPPPPPPDPVSRVTRETLLQRRHRLQEVLPHIQPPPPRPPVVQLLSWSDLWTDDEHLGPVSADGAEAVCEEPLLDRYDRESDDADLPPDAKPAKARTNGGKFSKERQVILNEVRRVQEKELKKVQALTAALAKKKALASKEPTDSSKAAKKDESGKAKGKAKDKEEAGTKDASAGVKGKKSAGGNRKREGSVWGSSEEEEEEEEEGGGEGALWIDFTRAERLRTDLDLMTPELVAKETRPREGVVREGIAVRLKREVRRRKTDRERRREAKEGQGLRPSCQQDPCPPRESIAPKSFKASKDDGMLDRQWSFCQFYSKHEDPDGDWDRMRDVTFDSGTTSVTNWRDAEGEPAGGWGGTRATRAPPPTYPPFQRTDQPDIICRPPPPGRDPLGNALEARRDRMYALLHDGKARLRALESSLWAPLPALRPRPTPAALQAELRTGRKNANRSAEAERQRQDSDVYRTRKAKEWYSFHACGVDKKTGRLRRVSKSQGGKTRLEPEALTPERGHGEEERQGILLGQDGNRQGGERQGGEACEWNWRLREQQAQDGALDSGLTVRVAGQQGGGSQGAVALVMPGSPGGAGGKVKVAGSASIGSKGSVTLDVPSPPRGGGGKVRIAGSASIGSKGSVGPDSTSPGGVEREGGGKGSIQASPPPVSAPSPFVDDSLLPSNMAEKELEELMGFKRNFDAVRLKGSYSFEHIFSARQDSVKNYKSRLQAFSNPAAKGKAKAEPKKKVPDKMSKNASRNQSLVPSEPVVEVEDEKGEEEKGPPMVVGKMREYGFLRHKNYIPVARGDLAVPASQSLSVPMLMRALQMFVVRKERASTDTPFCSRLSITFSRPVPGAHPTLPPSLPGVAGACRTLFTD